MNESFGWYFCCCCCFSCVPCESIFVFRTEEKINWNKLWFNNHLNFIERTNNQWLLAAWFLAWLWVYPNLRAGMLSLLLAKARLNFQTSQLGARLAIMLLQIRNTCNHGKSNARSMLSCLLQSNLSTHVKCWERSWRITCRFWLITNSRSRLSIFGITKSKSIVTSTAVFLQFSENILRILIGNATNPLLRSPRSLVDSASKTMHFGLLLLINSSKRDFIDISRWMI